MTASKPENSPVGDVAAGFTNRSKPIQVIGELEERRLPRGWTLECCAPAAGELEWWAVHRQLGLRGPATTKVRAMLAAWHAHHAAILSDE